MKFKNILLIQFTVILLLSSISYSQWWTKLYPFKSSTVSITVNKTDTEGNLFFGGYHFDSLSIFDTVLISIGREDCFILKIDTSGKLLSVQNFGGKGIDRIFDMAIKKDGSIVVTGIFQDEMQIGDTIVIAPVIESFFLAEFTKDNKLSWVKVSYAGEGDALCTNDNGDVVVAGVIRGKASFVDGDTIYSVGDEDVFLAYYDRSGGVRWVKRIGASIFERASHLSFSGNDKIYLAGTFVDTIVIDSVKIVSNSLFDQSFIALFDTTGRLLKFFTFLSDGMVKIYSFVNDEKGNIFISGMFSSLLTIDTINIQSEGESSMFIAALSSDGKIKWVEQALNASGNYIIFGPDSDLYVCGSFKRASTFGEFSVISKDVEDVFVSSYSLEGKCKWIITAGGCRASTATRIALFSPLFFVTGITEINLETAICHINFGNRLSTTYMLEDRGRAFLAVGNYLIDSTSVFNPLKKREEIFYPADKNFIKTYDLLGRELKGKVKNMKLTKGMPASIIITETANKRCFRYLIIK